MLPTLGPMELVIMLVIVLVIFGGGKLAGVGKSLGTAITEFKGAVTEAKEGAEAPSEAKGESEKEENADSTEEKSE